MRNLGLLLIVVLLLGLAALAFFVSPPDGDYDRSPLGSKGLQVWLQSKGIPVIRSDAHVTRQRSEISLRILPLPISQTKPTEKQGSEDKTGDRFEPWVYEAKLYELPTLIILPKWRDSVGKDGIARESALVPFADLYRDLAKAYPPDLYLKRLGPDFEEAQLTLAPDQSKKVALYRAQVFYRSSLPTDCKELAGIPAGALLLRCEDSLPLYLLSDPDLLNNHGLSLAENAAFAVSMIQKLRGENETRPVYLDTRGQLLETEEPVDEGRTYERSANDLKRFFAYPLSVIWGTILLVVVICLWRGAYRFGPPVTDTSSNIEMSKTAAIEATARLLRLSGNDGRMTAQFVQHLLSDKAVLLFGSGAGNEAGIERMFQRLARRDQTSAAALQSAAQLLIERGHVMTRSDLYRNLETFRKLLGSTDLGSR
ncbi:hypothetical protein HGP17_29715 [Rhizobium sp. P38BS-XIX]|uniref:hypothetical protein n=1 Tax=Rhizobium sp. P38BS-XIX TaxID=2726740 RepID=UPI001457801A|nr:hypothetical protein [Rhizobium sp. P38BS-XIX]NLS01029.1 hypothetical protein [Rhizobium sp. P38BS-XIX]